MAPVLTTDQWKKSRAGLEWRTVERKRIRLALLLIAAVLSVLGWYFGWFQVAPAVVSVGVW